MGLFPAPILDAAATVVLRHELVDGSFHFDWLLELRRGSDPDGRDLLSFRAPSNLSTWTRGGSGVLERTPDHRRLYLRFEGPLDGARGSVRRVGEGAFELIERTPSSEVVEVTWRTPGVRKQRVSLLHLEATRWTVRCDDCD